MLYAMHITTADPSNAPGALLAPIHQRHRGLTTITVRRKGAELDLVHAVLHDADKQPVVHGASPSDTPEEIAAALWSSIKADAHVRGAGTYDVTLSHAAAEKGTPPKPVMITLPCGHVREGIDQSAQTAMYVAQFCAGHLNSTLAQLPALVEAVGKSVAAMTQQANDLAEVRAQQGSAPAELEIARIQAQTEKDRWTRLESMLAGPLGDLRKRLKQTASPAPAPAARVAAPRAIDVDVVQPRVHAPAVDAPAVVDAPETPEQEIIRLGKYIGNTISGDAVLAEAVRATLDDADLFAGVDKLVNATSHSAVLDTLARLTVHPRRIDLLVLLDGPIADAAERIAELASETS